MIKYDESLKAYSVSYSRRPVGGGTPIGLRRIGIKTHAEAKRVERELIVAVNEKAKAQKIPKWKDFLEDYLLSLETLNLSGATRYNREKCLRLFTLDSWAERFIDEITREDVNSILNEKFTGKSEHYRQYFFKAVKSVFDYAVECQYIQRNPTPSVKFKIKSKIMTVLNEDQIMILLRKAQEQDWPWYPHYSVALFTGLRSGELYALKWDRVNLEKRQILVNCSWSSKDGFKSTKSGNDRIVEIPMPLLPLLRDLKLQSGGTEFVLPRLSRWDKGEQATELRTFLKANGLPEVRFHDLRASWATLLLDKGVAASKVMSMGGWMNIKTMMIYMRKAGINIRNSTHVLDGIQTHGAQEAEVVELRSL